MYGLTPSAKTEKFLRALPDTKLNMFKNGRLERAFKLLRDALKVKNVRSKIFFTIFILFVFRVGTHITVPGINAKSLENIGRPPLR